MSFRPPFRSRRGLVVVGACLVFWAILGLSPADLRWVGVVVVLLAILSVALRRGWATTPR